MFYNSFFPHRVCRIVSLFLHELIGMDAMLFAVKRRHEIRSSLSGGRSLDRVLELAQRAQLAGHSLAACICVHLSPFSSECSAPSRCETQLWLLAVPTRDK